MEKPYTKKLVFRSPAFENMGRIPHKYTCTSQNISPPLEISGVDENAKSLILIVDDPDAPVGNWDHWIVWNIPVHTTQIEENSIPRGAVEGMNDFNKCNYGGPCPPSGVHRYFFKLYAINIVLDLPSSTRKAELLKAIDGHIVDYTHFIGLYSK